VVIVAKNFGGNPCSMKFQTYEVEQLPYFLFISATFEFQQLDWNNTRSKIHALPFVIVNPKPKTNPSTDKRWDIHSYMTGFCFSEIFFKRT
jgi:hypothetical protein